MGLFGSKMLLDEPSPLLGGLTPRRFMRRHWQRRPLLVRAAWSGPPLIGRSQLFALAGDDGVESRLVRQHADGRWSVRRGPLARRSLPAVSRGGWSLLVQGVDLRVPAARSFLERFRFVPDARLDDAMISYATDGGGVGPHVDSYDVFLLQVAGARRWRVSPPGRDVELRDDVPLKMLKRLRPTAEWRLEAGDMLYLPPGWAHDGVAEGETLTCSIGFRSPARDELARELMSRLGDADSAAPGPLYRDAGFDPMTTPARIPAQLQAFALDAVSRALRSPRMIERSLGMFLSEPKASTWFDGGSSLPEGSGIRLDPRSRALYDRRGFYLNGEAFTLPPGDAAAFRRLADRRTLSSAAVARLSGEARDLLRDWAGAGWLRAESPADNPDLEGTSA